MKSVILMHVADGKYLAENGVHVDSPFDACQFVRGQAIKTIEGSNHAYKLVPIGTVLGLETESVAKAPSEG